MTSRRDFLRIGVTTMGALGAAAGLMGKLGRFTALASASQNAGAPYSALVCINLAGGNDGHNMVIPIATTQQNFNVYSASRQGLALPQAGLQQIFVNGSSDVYGLHPSMPELAGLFNSGKAAVLANVGMLAQPLDNVPGKTPAQVFNSFGWGSNKLPSNLFSHSDQSSQWQTIAANGISATGWGGRAADAISQYTSYNSGGQYPAVVNNGGCGPFCTGGTSRPGTVPPSGLTGLTGVLGDQARANGMSQVLSFDNGLKLVQAANGITSSGVAQGQLLMGLLASAKPLTTQFPANQLAAQLKMVAQIIGVHQQLGVNRQVFFCSLGGFDTHGTQLTDQAPLLQQLSQSIAAFYNATNNDLGLANAVTTFTTSEFGRTIMPNSNAGTDHAWGSHHFIVGGSVVGAKIYGQYPSLQLGNPLDVTGRGSLVPTTSVDQYAATLAQWFGVPADASPTGALTQVVPNVNAFPASDLGFFG